MSEIKPTKHFQRYSHIERADHAASHRLGHRQRLALGESFWTHPEAPAIAFKTRKACIRAVEATRASTAVVA